MFFSYTACKIVALINLYTEPLLPAIYLYFAAAQLWLCISSILKACRLVNDLHPILPYDKGIKRSIP